MPKLVVTTLLLVVVLGYGLAFVSWNQTPVTVVGWGQGEPYWETVPVAYVLLGGVGIGLVVMALASLGHWAGVRGEARRLKGQIAKAREVIEYQKRRIAELEGTVDELKRDQAQARATSQVAAAAPAAKAEPAAASPSAGGDVEEI